jgi:CHAT domain-containing protein
VARAALRLQQVQPILDQVPSFTPEIRFYSAQAEISLRGADSAATESALRAAIFLAEWALKSFPTEKARSQWAEQTQSAYRTLVAWKLRQGDTSAALELWEWYRGAEVRQNDSDTFLVGRLDLTRPPDARSAPPLPAPTAVEDRLPLLSSETVIVYAALPDGIAVWSYDDRGIISRWIAKPLPEVQDLVIGFNRLCSNASSDLVALRSTAQSLYDLLIAPVEDRFSAGRTLVFETDDALAAIPMEALIDPAGHYLVERASVVRAPGLYQTVRLRPAAAITGETPALVVSVPVAAEEGLLPLADVESEAQTVAAGFRSALWLKGRDANLSAIRRAIRGVSVFHFAGHAIALPDRTGLVLAERDGPTHRARLLDSQSFGLRDTEGLQLVVLSACQTRAAPRVGASGSEGLSQALLRSGVPHVVASRWSLDSTKTALFMKLFYARLLTGSNAADSIRAAELALASQPASAHPYYWSAFELQGVK